MKGYCNICRFKRDIDTGVERRAACSKYGDYLIKLYQTCDDFEKTAYDYHHNKP